MPDDDPVAWMKDGVLYMDSTGQDNPLARLIECLEGTISVLDSMTDQRETPA